MTIPSDIKDASKDVLDKVETTSKDILSSVETSVDQAVTFGGDVMNEFVNTVLGAIAGVADGANSVAKTTGDLVNMVLHDVIGERATLVFHGAGDAAKRVSDALGDVVTKIPLVGRPAAYLVQRAGDGVYHVVVSFGNVANSSTRRLGQLAQRGADLIVFTLTESKQQLLEVGKDVTDAVAILTKGTAAAAAAPRSRSASSPSKKRRKQAGGSRRQRRQQAQRKRRTQRGGARTVLPAEYFGGSSGAYTASCGRQTFKTAYGDSVPTSFGESVEGMGNFTGPNLAPGGTYATNMTTGVQTGGGKRRYRRRSK